MGLRLLVVAAFLIAAPAARAALVYDKGLSTGHPSVWIAGDDGGSPRRLATRGSVPKISPDGQTGVYQQSGSRLGLMKVPAAGGTPTALTPRVWPFDAFAWSPDSGTIVTVTGPEVGRRHLVLVDVATGASRTVMSGQFFGASFSPAGDRIVFARAASDGFPLRSSIYTAPVAGGAPTLVTQGTHSLYPVWGPASIAFARQRRAPRRGDAPKQDVYLMNPDGTGVRRLTRTKVPFLLSGLTPTEFSADGTRLLAEYGGQDTSFAETVDPATGRTRRVRGEIIGDRLSRDGSTILGTDHGVEESPNHDVVTVPYGGGTPTILVRRAYDPDWNR